MVITGALQSWGWVRKPAKEARTEGPFRTGRRKLLQWQQQQEMKKDVVVTYVLEQSQTWRFLLLQLRFDHVKSQT